MEVFVSHALGWAASLDGGKKTQTQSNTEHRNWVTVSFAL